MLAELIKNFSRNYAGIENYPEIMPVMRKLNDLGAVLKIAGITLFLHERLMSVTRNNSGSIPFSFLESLLEKPWDLNSKDIVSIENIFRNELSFFYYLNLDTIAYHGRTSSLMDNRSDYVNELLHFKSPRHTLIKSLVKIRKLIKCLKNLWKISYTTNVL